MTTAVPINCSFSGIRDIYLRTYTQTYPFLHGNWVWNKNSILPMEFAGYTDPVSHGPQAFEAQMIDLKTGYSKVSAGNKAGQTWDNDFFGTPTYDSFSNKLCGWVIGAGVQTRHPTYMEYPLAIDGATAAFAALNLTPITVSLDPSLGMPQPGAGTSHLTGDKGVYCSASIGGATFSVIRNRFPLPGVTLTDNSLLSQPLVYPTDGRFGPTIADSLGTWIATTSGLGGNVPYNVVLTDFVSFAQYFQVTQATQPASSTVNFANFFAAATNDTWEASPFGFMQVINATETFNGKTLAGYGVVVSNDFSEYAILNFIPQDNIAAQWNADGQGKTIKADKGGAIWMKHANSDSLLLVGTPFSSAFNFQRLDFTQNPLQYLPINKGLYR